MTLFQSQIDALVRADVRFVVIGGVAAGLHGMGRATFDLDICYDPAPDNRERLAAILSEGDAYLRSVEAGLPFVLDARQLEISPVMTLTTSLGDLDILDHVEGVGDFAAVLANSVETFVGDTRFRILDLPALIKAKRAANRQKDRDQLPELEALLEIRRFYG
ncbi:MAG: hypothetical protein OEO20_08710 [Gemmatimonadota bacterium]|nr:hypothetical protein [Gemmatimonadota bacterium]MDH3368381.1 hypothetical protein [Gemmatimonadota bacterium]MDH3478369.1 hypothetical protein [Gemmatimonadota bacterium]MDH3570271.1 hypothetical protein [Gemmatimonadota bacterium]MDH5550683.1 hypothetical protein [Gemmatimonadota bacterium]